LRDAITGLNASWRRPTYVFRIDGLEALHLAMQFDMDLLASLTTKRRDAPMAKQCAQHLTLAELSLIAFVGPQAVEACVCDTHPPRAAAGRVLSGVTYVFKASARPGDGSRPTETVVFVDQQTESIRLSIPR